MVRVVTLSSIVLRCIWPIARNLARNKNIRNQTKTSLKRPINHTTSKQAPHFDNSESQIVKDQKNYEIDFIGFIMQQWVIDTQDFPSTPHNTACLGKPEMNALMQAHMRTCTHMNTCNFLLG